MGRGLKPATTFGATVGPMTVGPPIVVAGFSPRSRNFEQSKWSGVSGAG